MQIPEKWGILIMVNDPGSNVIEWQGFIFDNDECSKNLSSYKASLDEICEMAGLTVIDDIRGRMIETDLIAMADDLLWKIAVGRVAIPSPAARGFQPLPQNATEEGAETQGQPGVRGARQAARDKGEPEVMDDYVISRPADKEKSGRNGTVIRLKANYYEVTVTPPAPLYQYNVEFVQEELPLSIRNEIIERAGNALDCSGVSDGSMIYTRRVIREDIDRDEDGCIDFECDNQYNIKIKLVGQVETGSQAFISMCNLILAKCMDAMELEEMGRYFVDHRNAIQISVPGRTLYTMSALPGKSQLGINFTACFTTGNLKLLP